MGSQAVARPLGCALDSYRRNPGGSHGRPNQRNGIRQGSPDSPVIFATRAAQILETTLNQTQSI